MVQKRPFGEEEGSYEVSSKHPRQLEHNDRLVSSLESPSEDVEWKPHTLGVGENDLMDSKIEEDGRLACNDFTEHAIREENEIDNGVFGHTSNTSWATSSTSEEDVRSQAPFHILLTPEYYKPYHPVRTIVHSEETYASLLEYLPRKPVPIGPDFQADIPEWDAQGINNSSSCSASSEEAPLSPRATLPDLVDHIDDEGKFAGTRIFPVLESESSAYNGDEVGEDTVDCCCEDAGSIRCVRQHIKEARAKLKKTLGAERFVELGFCDMGEVVAEKWSEEDEQVFHEIIFSNPASLGKNFWEHLSVAFPSRSKKEIISYYFNVFMLRRRAEQNRCDGMNVDSDNDEWQGSDDSCDDDGVIEEDDDILVESPVCQDDCCYNDILEDDWYNYEAGVAHAACHKYKDVDDDDGTNVSGFSPQKLLNRCSSDSAVEPTDRVPSDGRGDLDIQDDSSTSFETEAAQQVAQVKVDNSKQWTSTFTGNSSGAGQEFVSEPCDAKVWDAGYFNRPKNEFDLLPTCSMIEEVFGVGAWNMKSGDGKGFS